MPYRSGTDFFLQAQPPAYLSGAFIAADFEALVGRDMLDSRTRVVLSGHAAMAEAWAYALERVSVAANVLTEKETEQAFLAGLCSIAIACDGRSVTVPQVRKTGT